MNMLTFLKTDNCKFNNNNTLTKSIKSHSNFKKTFYMLLSNSALFDYFVHRHLNYL